MLKIRIKISPKKLLYHFSFLNIYHHDNQHLSYAMQTTSNHLTHRDTKTTSSYRGKLRRIKEKDGKSAI